MAIKIGYQTVQFKIPISHIIKIWRIIMINIFLKRTRRKSSFMMICIYFLTVLQKILLVLVKTIIYI